MKTVKKLLIHSLLGIAVLWILLTLFVEQYGAAKSWPVINPTASKHAMIVFDPDPFYNLEEQVGRAFGEGLVERGWRVKMITVREAIRDTANFELYVLLANTYNWAPDRGITGFVHKYGPLEQKQVVAITVGSGSTGRAHRLFREHIQSRGCRIAAEAEYWLMRPNDESRLDANNVGVACQMARELAINANIF